MPSVQLVIGRRTFPPLTVPEGCTVGAWKERVRRGDLGAGVHGARRLVCFAVAGGRSLGEDDPIPLAPAEVFVEGPTSVLGALTIALSGGSANHQPPAKPHKRQKSPKRMFFQSGLITGRHRRTNLASDDTTSEHDRASAEAINAFWFEELSQEDWFRLSHLIDDRIWRDFGALHRRAAAGELAGWKARPETCLALVVMLDQFSRRLYRGTAAAYNSDGLAREAASAALIRGDDHYHWPEGPRRCALYLPFVHVDDIAEKKRLLASLGARESSPSMTSTEELQRLLGVAAGALGPSGPETPTVPDEDKEQDDTFPFGDEEGTLSASASGGGLSEGSIVLPQLCSAVALSLPGRRRFSAFVFEADVGAFSDVGSSAYADTEEESSRADVGTLITSESGTSILAPEPLPLRKESGAEQPEATGGVRRPTPIPGRPPTPEQPLTARRPVGGPTLSKEISGSYPAQAALELPKIPSLTLNHEFGRRFRAMKLDKKTQQAYDRDKQALNMTTKYQCLVCSDRHDFRLECCRRVGW